MERFEEHIIRLIQLAFTGDLSEQERQELESWCREKPENRAFYESLSREEIFARELPLYHRIDEEKAMQRFEEVVAGNKRRHIPMKRLLRYAAVLVLPLLGVAIWQWNRQQPAAVVTQTITPGSSKAVLTLAGGRQVSLEGQTQQQIEVGTGVHVKQADGLLSYDSLAGKRTGAMEYNTLATGRGGEYRLILADGTQVFLNAASTLQYPVVFEGGERKVYLEGEAYFEVAKDAAHAFVVETKGMQVKVYGTSFNINAFRPDEVRTVLVEGRIGVSAAGGGREYRVLPGQMAVWKQSEGTVELEEVDVSLYTAWKDGIFRFSHERLEDILTTLANWYDVDVFYQSQSVKELHFSGYMERYEQIGTILEAITESTGVQFGVQGKTIVVSK